MRGSSSDCSEFGCLFVQSHILVITKVWRAQRLISSRVGLIILVTTAMLHGCQFGSAEVEASTPSSTAVIPTATAPVATLIPTATPTASPTVVTIPPSRSSSPVTTAPAPTSTPIPRPTAFPLPTTVEEVQEPTRVSTRGSIGRVALARKVDSLQRPVDIVDRFSRTERVYVSIEFKDVRAGAVLGVTWASSSKKIFTFETSPQGSFSRGFYAFFFDPGGVVGEFEAQILIDGEVVAISKFIVG